MYMYSVLISIEEMKDTDKLEDPTQSSVER